MKSMQQLNETSAKTFARSGFRCAAYASMSGTRPGYIAQVPHILASRHVLVPSILGNKSSLPSEDCSGWPSLVDALVKMTGAGSEFSADMKSTLS